MVKKLKYIKGLVEEISGIENIECKSRIRKYCYTRYVYMYLCKTYTKSSLALIGEQINRDHASVINGLQQFEIHFDQEYFTMYADIFYECKEIIKETMPVTDINKVKNITISSLKNDYRIRHFNFVNRYRSVLDKLRKKLEYSKMSESFQQVALLPPEDIEDVEKRLQAILKMKKLNLHNK